MKCMHCPIYYPIQIKLSGTRPLVSWSGIYTLMSSLSKKPEITRIMEARPPIIGPVRVVLTDIFLS